LEGGSGGLHADLLPSIELRSVALCTGVEECEILKINKQENKNKLVDVAPHWGEPHISCVLMCFVQYSSCCLWVYLLSALILMYDR
jgi:hypothetical protein